MSGKMIKRIIDLNCNIGRDLGICKLGCDEERSLSIFLHPILLVVFVLGPVMMKKIITLAKKNMPQIFMILLGLIVSPIAVESGKIKARAVLSTRGIKGITCSQGMSIRHVKPYGSLHNLADKNERLSRVIVEVVAEYEKN